MGVKEIRKLKNGKKQDKTAWEINMGKQHMNETLERSIVQKHVGRHTGKKQMGRNIVNKQVGRNT